MDEFQRTECRRCVESGKEKANSKLSHLAKVECVAFQNAGQSPNFKLIFFAGLPLRKSGTGVTSGAFARLALVDDNVNALQPALNPGFPQYPAL